MIKTDIDIINNIQKRNYKITILISMLAIDIFMCIDNNNITFTDEYNTLKIKLGKKCSNKFMKSLVRSYTIKCTVK